MSEDVLPFRPLDAGSGVTKSREGKLVFELKKTASRTTLMKKAAAKRLMKAVNMCDTDVDWPVSSDP